MMRIIGWCCWTGMSMLLAGWAAAAMPPEARDGAVSYYEDIRPLLQAKCHGCHQPAKSKGDYVMTTFEGLLRGGEEGEAVVPHDPASSYLVHNIELIDGKAEMPPKGDPLSENEVALIERWIAEGASDDTPSNAVERITPEHPPVYVRPPLVTSIDFSPDGKLLAVSGFHEVLLHHADGSGLVARLVGLSERIESVRFSPDGTRLAVTGGLPGRMGELQIWDVAKGQLDLSVPLGYDTLYGASWSPDGQLVALGMPDNTMRAFKASNGEQVVLMGGHNDWVLDTVFDRTGEHIISVGRDMSTKLTEVASERFVDNLTSITPGALKGGITALELHPVENHILVGGSDGVPQIYRTKRETVRKIGDNANLIRRYPAMPGRIWSVAFAPDGKRFVAGSSLNGKGAVHVYRSEYDATITPELKKAMETARKGPESEEQKMIDEWQTRGAEQLASLGLPTPVYAVAWSPDGTTVVAAGGDGELRFLDPATAAVTRTVVPVELATATLAEAKETIDDHPAITWDKEPLPEGVVALRVAPEQLRLDGSGRYEQLVVMATLESGEERDVTRVATLAPEQAIVEITERGKVLPRQDGTTTLRISLGGQSVSAPVLVTGLARTNHPDWITDVNPVISKMGCNSGMCHGAKDGKAGFKLSLRGYDPLYDVRGFTDDITSRRVNFASPDDSLMLLKMTAGVAHEGGQLTKPHSSYYGIVRDWIVDGAKMNLEAPRVTGIELYPQNPVVQAIGGRQQFRVVATLSDGERRDVTSEAFVESGNGEVAQHDDHAVLATLRRGEAPVLARYEGAYAATTLTVMGDREGFVWETPPAYNRIDELVASKWERMRILPSGLCSDEEFVRRVHLDLTGLPPSAVELRQFLADETPSREKRDALVDRLIGSPEFVDHWTNKWADLLQVNSKFLGAEGARIFRDWIREAVAANTPYDEFVYRILTATGSNKDNPAASYYKILREPDLLMENTTHLFLATRFNCNKCHDHPFERWTQDQYFETAAWFARVDLKRDTVNAPTENLGGTAVEGAKPLYEAVGDRAEGEVVHERTGLEQPPAFPYEAEAKPVSFTLPAEPNRREELAAWVTAPDNRYFAMSYANRIWGYLLGTGVIEPLDDIRAGNPPSNPELLDYLTRQFIESGFDQRKLIETICKSRTYQLSIETHRWNEDDEINFSHGKARRLPAEVLFDTVYAALGAVPNIPGAKPGVRAQQLPDVQLDLKSGFLANLGRPARESACECERSNDVQMSAVMAFLSGPTIADAVGDPGNDLPKLVDRLSDDRRLVEEIYLRILSRYPRSGEVDAALAAMGEIQGDHETLVAEAARAEAAWVPKRSGLEVTRLQAIAAARREIEAYEPEFQSKKQAAEKAQAERIAEAKKQLAAREAEMDVAVAEWEKGLSVQDMWTTWEPLVPKTATASDKSEVEILPDGSIRVTKHHLRNLDLLLSGETAMENVTGILLEAIPDETFPGFGAGLNPNGNFVVTEVQARWNDRANPKKQQPIKLAEARADFNQAGFDVANTINGVLDRTDKGWAISGSNLMGRHRATFRFAEPVAGDAAGATLTVGVLCRYSNSDYPLGRFRVWVTSSQNPLAFGLPREVAEAVRVAPAERTEAQRTLLTGWVRDNDAVHLERTFALAKEERPLPADAKMESLKQALAVAEEPVVDDPALVQLRQDLEFSIEQAANRRLTAAQDLAWALINNPAFLFNH